MEEAGETLRSRLGDEGEARAFFLLLLFADVGGGGCGMGGVGIANGLALPNIAKGLAAPG